MTLTVLMFAADSATNPNLVSWYAGCASQAALQTMEVFRTHLTSMPGLHGAGIIRIRFARRSIQTARLTCLWTGCFEAPDGKCVVLCDGCLGPKSCAGCRWSSLPQSCGYLNVCCLGARSIHQQITSHPTAPIKRWLPSLAHAQRHSLLFCAALPCRMLLL